MCNNKSWPFDNDQQQVRGMKLPEYLIWAEGSAQHPKKLLLPPIQRGFVWNPKRIVDLWDSLFRGMPIGSLMISKLSRGQMASGLKDKKADLIDDEAMGLLDGQQRTLAMLIGWGPFISTSTHCIWIDLSESGHEGAPFDIRLTTSAQPFGFQRVTQTRLSRDERRRARKKYDEKWSTDDRSKTEIADYDLFRVEPENEQPRPWKADSKPGLFVRVNDAWQEFSLCKSKGKIDFSVALRQRIQMDIADATLDKLYEAFVRMESLEVPLILIPEHINAVVPGDTTNKILAPLVLLFERIGRNGASLSSEDLLFSMIKQQWPEAQKLVNRIHDQPSVCSFMGATDYVMTAFRMAAAEVKIADTPRPNPNDFHSHLGALLGIVNDTNKPLRNYIENDTLALAFQKLFEVMRYKPREQDIGLPLPMMPHLSRGLVQVLLRWIMLNPDLNIIEENRQKIISFSLFWYLNVWHEDKASKLAFELINDSEPGTFPAEIVYKKLIDVPDDDEIGLALPLMCAKELGGFLIEHGASLRAYDKIFKEGNLGKPFLANFKQREIYKRFCWARKPVLLWLQRAYVDKKFSDKILAQFSGLTDEDCVPYDYDHLCPQNHWGAHWANITKIPNASTTAMSDFRNGRNGVGNCIGNLHILESGLNRSLGDESLASKLKCKRWLQEDSLLYHVPDHEGLWQQASPHGDEEALPNVNETAYKTWDEPRLKAFQSAVYFRAQGLYGEYVKACEHIMQKGVSE